jgi:hypothetical protein
MGHHLRVDRATPVVAADGKSAPEHARLFTPELSIFIGNLPFDASDEQVIRAFSEGEGLAPELVGQVGHCGRLRAAGGLGGQGCLGGGGHRLGGEGEGGAGRRRSKAHLPLTAVRAPGAAPPRRYSRCAWCATRRATSARASPTWRSGRRAR